MVETPRVSQNYSNYFVKYPFNMPVCRKAEYNILEYGFKLYHQPELPNIYQITINNSKCNLLKLRSAALVLLGEGEGKEFEGTLATISGILLRSLFSEPVFSQEEKTLIDRYLERQESSLNSSASYLTLLLSTFAHLGIDVGDYFEENSLAWTKYLKEKYY